MKKEDDKADLLVTLLEVFKEETDKEHKAKLNQLATLTANRAGKDKPLDIRTISGYISTLKQLGFVIVKEPGGYYLEKRYLDRSEAKLLCDQITFCTIMPAYRKKAIIEGLITDLSLKDQQTLKSDISVDYKSPVIDKGYANTLANAEKILQAIEQDKKIKFKYGDYDEKKELKVKPRDYVASPYEFVYEQGKYYIMALDKRDEEDGKTRNFRIDLMKDIQIGISKRAENPIDENLTDYCIKQLNMYSVEDEKPIILEADQLGLRGLYDKLGLQTNLKVKKISDEKYRIEFEASCEGTKFLVQQYIGHMKVIKPEKLKNDIKKILKEALEKYND